MPNSINIPNYVELLSLLTKLEILQFDRLLSQIIQPLVQFSLENTLFDEAKCLLHLVNSIVLKCDFNNRVLESDISNFIIFLLKLLDNNRVKFFEFSIAKVYINEEAVNFLNNILKILCEKSCILQSTSTITAGHFMSFHYVSCLTSKTMFNYFESIAGNFNLDDLSESVAKFIKILPSCVPSEWYDIVLYLKNTIGPIKTMELLTDILILLSQLTSTQSQSTVKEFAFNGLKYCIQNYSNVSKNLLLVAVKDDVKKEVVFVKSICQVIKELPAEMKEDEGLKLTLLLPDKVLQNMRSDKEFVSSLVIIGNVKISQLIAKKVLS